MSGGGFMMFVCDPVDRMRLSAALLDLPGSLLVGDKASDLDAGRAAGLTRLQLVADDGSWSLP